MRRILVLESVTSYCGRERSAGVFRYARTHGGWEIRLLNESEESLRLGRFDYAEADGVIVSAKVPVPKTLKLWPETTVYVSYLCRYADAKWSKVCNDNAALAEACAAHLSARKCVSYAYFRYLDMVASGARDRCSQPQHDHGRHPQGHRRSVHPLRSGDGHLLADGDHRRRTDQEFLWQRLRPLHARQRRDRHVAGMDGRAVRQRAFGPADAVGEIRVESREGNSSV